MATKIVKVHFLQHMGAHCVSIGKDNRFFSAEAEALKYAGFVAEQNHMRVKYPMPDFARMFIAPQVEIIK